MCFNFRGVQTSPIWSIGEKYYPLDKVIGFLNNLFLGICDLIFDN